MDNNQEREINLISLCFRILLKWRWLIICAIICAVLAGGYKYYKDYKAYTNMTEEAASLAATKVEATNSQIRYVQDAIEYRLNRIEILQIQLLDTLAAIEHIRHSCHIGRIEVGDVQVFDKPTSVEHRKHILYLGGIERRYIEALDIIALPEHIGHR